MFRCNAKLPILTFEQNSRVISVQRDFCCKCVFALPGFETLFFQNPEHGALPHPFRDAVFKNLSCVQISGPETAIASNETKIVVSTQEEDKSVSQIVPVSHSHLIESRLQDDCDLEIPHPAQDPLEYHVYKSCILDHG